LSHNRADIVLQHEQTRNSPSLITILILFTMVVMVDGVFDDTVAVNFRCFKGSHSFWHVNIIITVDHSVVVFIK